MTKQDIVNAYIRGDVDRRGFIRRLTAVGVSAGAAMAYASALLPGVSAGSVRNGAGFITRFQDADGDYGTAVVIEDMPAALTATMAAVEATAALASSILSTFSAEDFVAAGLDEGDVQILSDIVEQMRQHQEALQGILDNVGGGTGEGGAAGDEAEAPAFGDLTEALEALSGDLDGIAGMYVAITPSIEDVEDRLLLAQKATVAGRHAASVARMAGLDPVPAAFEEPLHPNGE